jgi:hypothetical protein
MSVFKIQTIRYFDKQGKRVKKHPNAIKKVEISRKWYGQAKIKGKWKRFPLYTDKQSSEQHLAQIVKEIERKEVVSFNDYNGIFTLAKITFEKGKFPIDMLRRCGAFPARKIDSETIQNSFTEKNPKKSTCVLVRYSQEKLTKNKQISLSLLEVIWCANMWRKEYNCEIDFDFASKTSSKEMPCKMIQ